MNKNYGKKKILQSTDDFNFTGVFESDGRMSDFEIINLNTIDFSKSSYKSYLKINLR